MLEHRLDPARGVLYLRPQGALREGDFAELARSVDPYIEANGSLAGILLEAPGFPGWDSLGALAAHFRFVRDHHRKVRKIAIVTDALLGDLAEKLASHFVAAKIRHFPAAQAEAAQQWIQNPDD
jgi:stage II sporulation SpoAA-like protein